MSRKFIPVGEVAKLWFKNPDFIREYDAREEEFALASQLIGARARAGLTQEELATRMNTTRSAIARLESGRFRSSTRTLEKLAAATGSKLRIVLEPGDGKQAA